MMITLLVALAGTAVSAIEITPEPGVTYEFKREDEEKPFYGFFYQLGPDGKWSFDDEKTIVILDKPWQKKRDYRSEDTNDLEVPFPERAAHRDKRLGREGRDAGYAYVETVDGKGWVEIDELERAAQATAMALEVQQKHAKPEAQDVEGAGELVGATESEGSMDSSGGLKGPGFFVTWWKHGVVVVVAIGLIAGVSRFTFF